MAQDNERPARDNDGEGRRERNRFSDERPRNDRGEKKIFNRRDKNESNDRRPYNSDRREEGGRRSFGERPERRDNREGGERRPFNRDERRDNTEGGERRTFNRADRRDNREGGERRTFNRDDRNADGVKKFSFNRNRNESDDRGEAKPRREEGDRRSFGEDRGEGRRFGNERGERRPAGDRREDTPKRSFGERPERGERRDFNSDRRDDRRAPREGGEERRSFKNDRGEGDRRPFNKDRREGDRRPFNNDRDDRRTFNRDDRGERKSYTSDKNEGGERRNFREGAREERPYRRDDRNVEGDKRSFNKDRGGKFEKRGNRSSYSNRNAQGEREFEAPNYNIKHYENNPRIKKSNRKEEDDGTIRLNRYIANAGICSRREADTLIESGEIKVNGHVVTEMGFKVKPEDSVQYGKKILNREKLVYVLLNKPKDFLTTTDDPEGRKTVMSLVEKASKERIFPVGRLDRNTTGLLLFTNDGELAQKLTHPSNGVKKIYQVELDKPISKEDFLKVAEGIELEDGKAEVDDVALIGDTNRFLGLEIHIGRNRIVRRIFEHLGYEVVTLDRVQYAGLTKKDLPRGNWRYISEKELIRLKYFV